MTISELSRERDLAAYGVVGCARAIARALADGDTTPEMAAKILRSELAKYDEIDKQLMEPSNV